MDPNNLLCQAVKWRNADVAAADGDLDAGLARITARVVDVAFTGDLFFPPEDIRADAERISSAVFREIGSVWGHLPMFNLREHATRRSTAFGPRRYVGIRVGFDSVWS
jgi:homoserine O-acetyltransferase